MNEPDDKLDNDERYLWDRSGPPDPLVARLEERLAAFRHAAAASPPAWLATVEGEVEPGTAPESRPSTTATGSSSSTAVSRWMPRRVPRSLALAATLAALVIGTGWWWLLGRSTSAAGWQVTAVAGGPRLAGERLAGRKSAAFHPGDDLETGPHDRARLALAGVGEVVLGPSTRLRLGGGERPRLTLERGVLLAAITAPPRVFEVVTPRARAVDLGCLFTLEVHPDGGERLRVEAGWVALLAGGREAFVPGGAVVELPPGGALGAPVQLAADRELQRAVRRFERDSDPAVRAAALATVLERARRADALTLWHLLAATEGEERQRVYDRLAQLVPPPPGVNPETVADGAARDLWWEALGLGTASWWRRWRLEPPR